MANFKIDGSMKIKTLRANFTEEFGSTLRLYDGNSFASDDDKVSDIAKNRVKRGEEGVSANGNLAVKTFEKRMKDVYGIRAQVATKDDSDLVDNDISLTDSGKV
jgi:hypothetical protein